MPKNIKLFTRNTMMEKYQPAQEKPTVFRVRILRKKRGGEYADNEGGVKEQSKIYELILKGKGRTADHFKSSSVYIFALGFGGWMG